MKTLLSDSPIIAVITIQDPKHALPLASALIEAEIYTLEIVLRTSAALDCIKIIAHEFPSALVGAGTVIDSLQIDQCKSAGAKFIVSPGVSDQVIKTAKLKQMPILPGIATATEVMQVLAHGIQVMKLFPANLVGGIKALQTFFAVFPEVKFCPTGGITIDSAREFYKLKNVISVGGSWLTPEKFIKTQNWSEIYELAKRSIAQLQ